MEIQPGAIVYWYFRQKRMNLRIFFSIALVLSVPALPQQRILYNGSGQIFCCLHPTKSLFFSFHNRRQMAIQTYTGGLFTPRMCCGRVKFTAHCVYRFSETPICFINKGIPNQRHNFFVAVRVNLVIPSLSTHSTVLGTDISSAQQEQLKISFFFFDLKY